MKQDPLVTEIQKRMSPGVITSDGFIGNDTRNLQEIIDADQNTVNKLNLTNKQIADKMTQLINIGKTGLSTIVNFDKNIQVMVESFRGKLPCPFKHPGLIEKLIVTVINNLQHDKITFTALNVHMIKEHGFYEGKGSAFRLEPEKLAKILDITPTNFS